MKIGSLADVDFPLSKGGKLEKDVPSRLLSTSLSARNRYVFRVAFSLLVLLVLLHTILPNNIERILLSIEFNKENYPLLLTLLVMAVVSAAMLSQSRHQPFRALLILLYLSLVVFSQFVAWIRGDSQTIVEALFSFAIYASPIAGIALSQVGTNNGDIARKLLVFGVLIIIGSQGIVALVNVHVKFLGGLTILQGGDEFRQGFSTYRFGSTAAAANTSANLLALCMIPAMRMIDDRRTKFMLVLFVALSVIGYQSRSAILILILALQSAAPRLRIKHLLVIAVASVGLIVLLLFIREADEIDSSNLYRLYLALDAFNAISSGGLLEILFGHGPDSGVAKNLTAYYGGSSGASQTLLVSSESALLTFVVEIGVVGAVLFLLLVYGVSLNPFVFLAFVSYILLDPSFLRQFEAILSILLISAASVEKRLRSPGLQSRLRGAIHD